MNSAAALNCFTSEEVKLAELDVESFKVYLKSDEERFMPYILSIVGDCLTLMPAEHGKHTTKTHQLHTFQVVCNQMITSREFANTLPGAQLIFEGGKKHRSIHFDNKQQMANVVDKIVKSQNFIDRMA